MAIVLPISHAPSLLITNSDLGKGFSLDEAGNVAKKSPAFVNKPEVLCEQKHHTDSDKLQLIRDQQSLMDALGVGGEISLSYGLISGRILGDCLQQSASSNDQLIFLYNRQIVVKVVELKEFVPTEDIELIQDLDSLRTRYGFYYISKIQYGAMIDVKITVNSTDSKTMKKLKGELGGSINLGAFKFAVAARSSSSKISISYEVSMAGCKQVKRTDAKSFEDVEKVLDQFEPDESGLIPINIELARYAPDLTPLLSFDSISVANYTKKLSTIGSNHWRFEVMKRKLKAFTDHIIPLTEDDEISLFVDKLCVKCTNVTTIIQREQDKAAKFLQEQTIEDISKMDLPHSEEHMIEREALVNALIGKSVITTKRGRWLGPAINGVPVYKGRYMYNDSSVYEGYCLDGKREGKGILKFENGNLDLLQCINGIWKDDEVSYPSIVTFVRGHSPIMISTKAQCMEWQQGQKAKRLVDSIEIQDKSKNGVYIKTLRVHVDKIGNEEFQQFYNSAMRQRKRDRYYIAYLGMTGTGKTTMVEYFLNVLTGQVHAAQPLRAKDIETGGKAGDSQTVTVCRYEIDYIYKDTWMFGIVLIDTPGFADVGGMDKDKEHLKSILEVLSTIKYLNGVHYVVSGSLTRRTLEPLRVMCNVFSIMPSAAFDCISTMISFCDCENQAKDVVAVLNGMMSNISSRPCLYLDNPWAQHKSNTYRGGNGTTGVMHGLDNTDELLHKLDQKSSLVRTFFLDTIRADTSFESEGMAELNELKTELLTILANLAEILSHLHGILSTLTTLTDKNIQDLVAKSKVMKLEEWCMSRGYAYVDGVAKAKVVSNIPFPGGVYSTVCFAPDCETMVCHQGCYVNFTAEKGHNIFLSCAAFKPDKSKCNTCSKGCSYQQHVHTQCQLKWIENDSIASSFVAIRNGMESCVQEVTRLQTQAETYRERYEAAMGSLTGLRERFKKLAVLGDIRSILISSKLTYEQQYEITVLLNADKAAQLRRIVVQIDSFLQALDESEVKVSEGIMHKIHKIVHMGFETAKKVLF